MGFLESYIWFEKWSCFSIFIKNDCVLDVFKQLWHGYFRIFRFFSDASFGPYSLDTGRKLNAHKTFRRRPKGFLNVLCTFNLRPVSTGYQVSLMMFLSKAIIWQGHQQLLADVLKNFAKIHKKTPVPHGCNSNKNRLQQINFPVNFPEFLRTHFL